MAAYDEFMDKSRQLGKLVSGKTRLQIPDQLLGKAVASLDQLLASLQPYCPPSPYQKRQAKEHPISAQIVNFTTQDSERKKIFDLGYFKRKFEGLPADRKIVASSQPKTLPAFRDAVILYYYRQGQQDDFKQLRAFRGEIEADYKNHPQVKRVAEARDILRELLSRKKVKDIASILQGKFPKDADLRDFAKIVKLTIPAQSRAKQAPQKTAHERLAEKIYSQGGIVRMRLD